MQHDYYCMGCGKLLSEHTVLFDLQWLLTRDKSANLQILKFRMTQEQLRSLIAAGQLAEAGYRRCSLTLQEVMGYVSNENNLNNPAIAQLTIEDINAYMKKFMTAAKAVKKEEDDIFNMDDDDVLEEIEEEQEEQAYEVPEGILAIEGKDTSVSDLVFVRSRLKSDFEVLQDLFGVNETYEFQIREILEDDDKAQKVFVGYELNTTVGGYFNGNKSRVCCGCGTQVFEHAGTAKHQAVSFIGYQKAGKTSAILALTHYAENYMITGFGSEIWQGKEMIESIASVEVLDKSDRLKADLLSYNEGYAPPKTEDGKREDAYCATFRIKNKTENKYYLLTLTDLPGELCRDDGTVDKENVYKSFPVAMSCDAFVVCFDSSTINAANGGGGTTVVDKVMNVCKWANEFQKMRATQNQVATFVPTMLLFTKCKDLEDPNAPPVSTKGLLPLEQMYLLKEEKLCIARNGVYKFVCEQFNEFGQLRKGYHAMMRCSPFGYPAPPQQAPDAASRVEVPRPRNIDILMRWLLSVAGSIPTEASYKLSSNGIPYVLHDFCISRPQLRSQNPLVTCDVDESMARCAVFENPGRFDTRFVGSRDQGARLFLVRLDSKMHPDSNDKE